MLERYFLVFVLLYIKLQINISCNFVAAVASSYSTTTTTTGAMPLYFVNSVFVSIEGNIKLLRLY